MAITRRQFVTRLGALAAAAGMGQADLAKISEAFAYGSSTGRTNMGGTLGKPRVVWVHGAECTGCSTSLLSFFEDASGKAVEGTDITTGAALGLAKVLPTELGNTSLTYHALGYNVDGEAVNIADVVVDVIDLQYHETVMNMGGDLAYKWLKDFSESVTGTFVLVVEGAVQPKDDDGAWSDASADVPWCSIGKGDQTGEHDFPTVVEALSAKAAKIISIGQCASFGGYPACKPPIKSSVAGFDVTQSQTGALGVYDFLIKRGKTADAAKVINSPGCPTNPWWFCLNVVLLLVDLNAGTTYTSNLDSTRRVNYVYPTSVHSAYCSRYKYFAQGIFASKPGQKGCLQKIGCKGPATRSLCGRHGWNGQQPNNATSLYGTGMDVSSANLSPNGTKIGGHCTNAGHPCMACTEKGYPDSFVPFVVRS